MNRRDLLKRAFWGSSALAVGGISQLSMIRSALAAQETEFNDYKALVCVMLLGGNDSVNLLVPSATSGAYAFSDYEAARESLAVADNALSLSDYYQGNNLSANPYGTTNSAESAYVHGALDLVNHDFAFRVNSVAPEMAKLIDDNKMTIIANSGNLIAPINKDEYLSKSVERPPFLFAHNHQQRAMFTGWGDNLKAKGWAGRLADAWLNENVNPSSSLGLNISYGGSSRLQEGNQTQPLILPSTKIPAHSGLTAGSNRRALFQSLLNEQSNHHFDQLFQQLSGNSVVNLESIKDIWDEQDDLFAGVTDSYGNELFSKPSEGTLELEGGISSGLINQLSAVAKMIHIGHNSQTLASNRQIFYVTLGGFDTHANQSTKHPGLLRNLSLALDKFQRAMEHLNLSDKVSLFSMSDFGRTVRSNGDGTDHAWGSHSFVMGGAVQGSMLGNLPDLSLGGEQDVTKKGRLLPTTAQDQVNATLTSWFGVEDELIKQLFPNIDHFQSNHQLSSAFLPIFK